MSLDSALPSVSADAGAPEKTDSSWLAGHVLNPFINGTGAIQLANNFRETPQAELEVAQTSNKVDWAIETLSSTAGAIIPYAIAAKVLHVGARQVGSALKLEAGAARIINSESLSQIAGAGLYDAAKAPNSDKGETRLGNFTGTVAGFTVFSSGNFLVGKFGSSISTSALRLGAESSAKVVVGALGGLTSLETSSHVSNLLGMHNDVSKENLVQSMESGAFINTFLPVAHLGLQFVGKQFGAKVPVGRYAESLNLNDPELSASIAKNPLASVKVVSGDKGVTGALVDSNTVGDYAAVGDVSLKDVGSAGEKSNVVPFDKAAWGEPEPWGATITDKGVNFAIPSAGAKSIELLLFEHETDKVPSATYPLFKSGDVWHRHVDGLKAGSMYLYRVDGDYTPTIDGQRFNKNKAIVDPSAKAITGDTVESSAFGYDVSNLKDPLRHLKPSEVDNTGDMPKAVVVSDKYDWRGDKPPATPMSDSIIYEMHLAGFTEGDKALGNLRGTYRGLIEKIPYLKSLGITAVELMPIFEFDKDHWPHYDFVTGNKLGDSWGYNSVGYRAPEARFAADGRLGQQVNEFKDMVRELHKENIEVILDVVFNHTREGNAYGPTINFRGLDNKTWYLLDHDHPENYIDHTGCGNTLNCNNPTVQKYILDSLKYWVNEMHVDGFRFDLATIFKYETDNSQQDKTSIIKAIEEDPLLSKVKLIAEPWGPDNYYLGRFSDKTWAEWNGDYRDVLRKFLKGDEGQVSILAERIAGSPKWFDQSKGRYSINFINCHDGFTLHDLVSYNWKHNERNAEGNNDGSNDNHSWNSGIEGPVDFNLNKALDASFGALDALPAVQNATISRFEDGTSTPISARTYSRKSDLALDGAQISTDTTAPPNITHVSLPIRTSADNKGVGLLNVDIVGQVQPGYTETLQSVARQAAYAIEQWNAVEQIPAEKRTEIEQLRNQRMKNFMTVLFMSKGVPMFLYGDEVGRTTFGNNNSWCQELLNMFDWEQPKEKEDMLKFVQSLPKLRQESQIGRAELDHLWWHGVKPMAPDWSDSSHYLGLEIKPPAEGAKRTYMAMNSYWEPLNVELPAGNWHIRVDSTAHEGQDSFSRTNAPPLNGNSFVAKPNSVTVFESD